MILLQAELAKDIGKPAALGTHVDHGQVAIFRIVSRNDK